jgi:hypothetical protein
MLLYKKKLRQIWELIVIEVSLTKQLLDCTRVEISINEVSVIWILCRPLPTLLSSYSMGVIGTSTRNSKVMIWEVCILLCKLCSKDKVVEAHARFYEILHPEIRKWG